VTAILAENVIVDVDTSRTDVDTVRTVVLSYS
jgi:hypothetical protein